MTDDQLFRAWVEPFDVFVSYARNDNPAPDELVTAFVEHLKADFGEFTPGLPLNVFFDKRAILDGQYWQDQIYKALRQSKSMIAILSRAYFDSVWCRKEWDEYVRLEQARTFPGEALTPIYVVAPEALDKLVPDHAREWWGRATRRNAVVELVPYWQGGRALLREAVVAERIARIGQTIRVRVEFGRKLEAVPRDLEARNPNFAGRDAALAELRGLLTRHQMAGLCAVNGVGGVGKSTVATEYAHRFRPEYLGGQFEVKLAGVTTFGAIQSALVHLARAYSKCDIPPGLPEDEQYARAKAHFDTLPAGQTALVIFDNLDEDATGLLNAYSRTRLPSAERVHYLVTTRADARLLGGMATHSLDVLSPADALDVLFAYKTFAFRADDSEYLAARRGDMPAAYDDAPQDAEWKAALAIVNKLGRHSLAVALVGAYLGTHALGYRKFLADMTAHGIGLALEHVGNDEAVKSLIAHPQTLIGQLFEKSLALLSKLALRSLEYAAFLPPDGLPVAWLHRLIQDDPEMAAELVRPAFKADPWAATLQSLDGLDYLKGNPYARMHRVVQEVVRGRLTPEARAARRGRVMRVVEARAVEVADRRADYVAPAEFEAVLAFLAQEQPGKDHPLGRTAMAVVDRLQARGRLLDAIGQAQRARQLLHQLAAADTGNAELQRDLSIALNMLGKLSVDTGDLAAARSYYAEALAVAGSPTEADPGDMELQRDRSVSLNKFGDLSAAAGDPAAARVYYADALAIAQRLAAANPGITQLERDLSISLGKMGDVCARVAAGDIAAAVDYFASGLAIAERLAEADPQNAELQRDLAVSNSQIATLMDLINDPEGHEYRQKCCDIFQSMIDRGLHVSPQDRQFLVWLKAKLGT